MKIVLTSQIPERSSTPIPTKGSPDHTLKLLYKIHVFGCHLDWFFLDAWFLRNERRKEWRSQLQNSLHRRVSKITTKIIKTAHNFQVSDMRNGNVNIRNEKK